MTDAVYFWTIVDHICAAVAGISAPIAMLLGFHNKQANKEIKDDVRVVKTQTDGMFTAMGAAKDAKNVAEVQVAHLEGVTEGVKSEQNKSSI